MRDFWEAINRCNLIDAGYNGDKFTWAKNKANGNAVKERLDRFFMNVDMNQKLKFFKVEHSNFHNSNHRPIVLSMRWENSIQEVKSAKKITRFEESWGSFEKCKEILEKSWKENGLPTTQNFNNKIQLSLKAMSSWTRRGFKDP